MISEQGSKGCLINPGCERVSGPREIIQNWEQKYKMTAVQEVRGGNLSKID